MITERTLDFQGGDGSVLQSILCFRFHDWVDDSYTIFSNFFGGVLAKFVFLSVNTQALGHKVNFNTFNMFYKSGDWWQQLLVNVPVSINLELVLGVQELIRTVCLVPKASLLILILSFVFANYVRNKVIDQVCVTLTLRLHSYGYLDVW